MVTDDRPRTPGSRVQIAAAGVLAFVGAFLCVSAITDGRALPAVVAALQFAIGVYLLVWHLRERRRPR
jgi:Flp pilus assembly protein TadB